MSRLAVVSTIVLALAVTRAGARPLPGSAEAPAVGQKAPDFRLQEVGGKEVSLSDLRSAGHVGSWVLLVFYRGYW